MSDRDLAIARAVTKWCREWGTPNPCDDNLRAIIAAVDRAREGGEARRFSDAEIEAARESMIQAEERARWQRVTAKMCEATIRHPDEERARAVEIIKALLEIIPAPYGHLVTIPGADSPRIEAARRYVAEAEGATPVPPAEEPTPEWWICQSCGKDFDRKTFSHAVPDADGNQVECGPVTKRKP